MESHCPGFGVKGFAEFIREVAVGVSAACLGETWLIAIHCAPSMKATRIKLKATTRTTDRRLMAGTPPDTPLRDGTIEPARPGNNAIKRAAIVSGPGDDGGRPGSAAIKEVNLSIAVLPGNRARSAASCQGSTSSRANAERTLSSIPFLSSPTGANRKASNSDPSLGSDAEFIMSLTESAGLPLLLKPSNQQSCTSAFLHAEKQPQGRKRKERSDRRHHQDENYATANDAAAGFDRSEIGCHLSLSRQVTKSIT